MESLWKFNGQMKNKNVFQSVTYAERDAADNKSKMLKKNSRNEKYPKWTARSQTHLVPY